MDLTSIINDVNVMLPQLSDFIGQFNNLVSQSNINVITDSAGNMSIDVPIDMSEPEAQNIKKRIGIIDRLINTQGQNINDLLQKGKALEENLKQKDPNYTSQLTDKINQFKQLNSSYKH